MNLNDPSSENGRKLDRILVLLEGDENVPGIFAVVRRHGESIYGSGDRRGLESKVDIMWRAHVYLLCAMSAAFGYICKAVFEKVFH